ncbi:Holliday junction resolvase RuvX [Mycoplasma iguanae]|uniref:Putative pre-16S rRNA nuclease n=1 Tax=Mycoplasma iguanae TaxID=292461 RepID=A0ABY5R806_9MOLU|nr:Holliday junction resolvase RuvX [Mycoplasma iguanae]UVD81638.1 Holliday junction resolvase RuvX [Mycoplasma iguanae]
MSRILALDLGTKTCGFAITDELKVISQALDNFLFAENQFDEVIEEIKRYFSIYKIEKIVLGYPTRMTGTKSERTFMVENFHEKLKNNFQVPIILIDERLSTKQANEIMRIGGLSQKRRKQKKDKMAAQIILENYLTGG